MQTLEVVVKPKEIWYVTRMQGKIVMTQIVKR